MSDDDFRRQLSRAAGGFPVRGRPADLRQRVVRRRRITAGFATAAGVLAAVGVALVVVPMLGGTGPGPEPTVPPAFSANAAYVGSHWRLTGVAEGAGSTSIPAAVGAGMDLLPDGRILVDTSVNALTGSFAPIGDGFEVRDVGTTMVLYDGDDPHRLTAVAALNTLAYGNREGVTPPGPVRDTVVGADGTRLVVQAGTFRLTFERTGPASGKPN
jgi:hypothetical protein